MNKIHIYVINLRYGSKSKNNRLNNILINIRYFRNDRWVMIIMIIIIDKICMIILNMVFDFVFINIIIHINVMNFIIYIIFMSQSLVVVQIG